LELSPSLEDRLRIAGAGLAAMRRRPCLLLVLPIIRRAIIPTLRAKLSEVDGPELDVMLYSGGGAVDAAYLAARELRRRVRTLTIFVPLLAKSAATLVCLAADEIVLGPLGELGPLDAQAQQGRNTGSAVDMSGLVPFKAIEELRDVAANCYDHFTGRIMKDGGMPLPAASDKASELTSALLGPIFGQMDPGRVAESARGLELAAEYAGRLLRRYRPELHARCEELLHRLIHAYPSHGFVIDLEEAQDLGLPARGPDAREARIVDALASAFIDQDETGEIIEVAALPADGFAAGAGKGDA
jgi:hypothetical protein